MNDPASRPPRGRLLGLKNHGGHAVTEQEIHAVPRVPRGEMGVFDVDLAVEANLARVGACGRAAWAGLACCRNLAR